MTLQVLMGTHPNPPRNGHASDLPSDGQGQPDSDGRPDLMRTITLAAIRDLRGEEREAILRIGSKAQGPRSKQQS